MTDQQRLALADRVVGGSADLLERVRIRQHQPLGTPRDSLIVDVAQSLTKMCDLWISRDPPVIEVLDALYREVGLGSASSCAGGDWPATEISCDTVFRIGNQAGAGVERARIWLTTLGAVKTSMNPVQQVSEPAETAEVWVIVYDGLWRCCPNAFDENGNLIPQGDQTRWLVVAEAAREGTGFIYLQDWTGKPVSNLLPLADR